MLGSKCIEITLSEILESGGRNLDNVELKMAKKKTNIPNPGIRRE